MRRRKEGGNAPATLGTGESHADESQFSAPQDASLHRLENEQT